MSVQKCGIEVHKLSSNLSWQLPSSKEVVEKCVVTWLVVIVVLCTVVVACVLATKYKTKTTAITKCDQVGKRGHF